MEKIKSSELRIGNLVFDCAVYEEFLDGTKTEIRPQRTVTINAIGYKTVSVVENHPLQFLKYESIKPIPLTEEWLLRFGFILIKETYYFTDGFICFECSKNIELYLEVEGQLSAMTHVKNVHQLQNLYFALRGEELTIKS